MRLYKYRELKDGDDQAMERFQSILEQRVFWCARPDTLNDDQEFAWQCDYRRTEKTIGLLAGLLSVERSKPYAEAWVQLEPFMAANRFEHVAAPVIAGLIQKCRSEIGLACFGTSPNNPTLWSRYGGDGQGACIEVDVPDDIIGHKLFWIQYTKEKVVHIDELLRAYFGSSRVFYELALLTKTAKWAPEEEVRFVSSAHGVSVRIEGARVSNVYLGAKLSPLAKRTIENFAMSLPHGPLLPVQPGA